MIKTDVLVIGAGPAGLFAVQQLGLIGLKAEVVDNLDKIGGQCIELYPDKPIYDIPALPVCTGESLTKNLLEQIKPFKTNFHLSERVQEISKEKNNWKIVTNKNKTFIAPNIIIAGGVGSFEPRKFSIQSVEKFENNGIFYSIKDKNYFKLPKPIINRGGCNLSFAGLKTAGYKITKETSSQKIKTFTLKNGKNEVVICVVYLVDHETECWKP